MSASVYNPISLELPRARIPLSDRTLVFKKNAFKAKRVLFEPVDHLETEKFLQQQMSKQVVIDSKRWGFDFLNGVPLTSEPVRYEWKPVEITDVKQLHVLQKKRPLEIEDHTEDLYHQLDDIVASNERIPEPIEEELSQPKKKQCRITDFMTMKKHAIDQSLAKKATPRPTPSAVSNTQCTAAS